MSVARPARISRRVSSSTTPGLIRVYTFTRRPVVLVWSEHFERITDGIAVERQIKGWVAPKKKH
jgi:putative endonuclease